MNKKSFLYLFVLLLSLVGTSTLFAEETIVNANNRFAFELYSKYKSEKGNIFFSPYSISSALAMTYEGARGNTADEMLSVLHFPKDNTQRRNAFLQLNNQINKKDKKYQLQTANALWAQKDYVFIKDYFSVVEKYYSGQAKNLDFIKETEKSRLTINGWVEKQTNNKIRDLIPQGFININTRLILTNAIYFKADWVRKFDKGKTKEEYFSINPVKKIKVPMMILKNKNFNYSETEQLQILELFYTGYEISMLILLPKTSMVDSLEKSINVEKLATLRNSLRLEEVDVFIPKFKFSSKYFMEKTLTEMGMSTAFSSKADFSGMTGKKELYISQVIHQAFVDVNEEGTEAAAATVGGILTGIDSEPRPPKIFKADHPFIFIIQIRDTGNILFIGRVNNPLSE